MSSLGMGRLRQCLSWLAEAGGDVLFPPHCLACRRELGEPRGKWPFCDACFPRICPETWTGCSRCGWQTVEYDGWHRCCPACQRQPLKFEAAVVLGSYHGGLRDLILRMKTPSHTAVSSLMGRLLAEQRHDLLAALRPDLIVPIPMHWRRRLLRGVNSPEIVARCLGKSLQVPVRRDVLIRCNNTLPQAELSPTRRFENMRGAFQARHPEITQSARILLVDDILTTGATCSEAAKVLRRCGASAVAVAVLARAQGQRG